MDKEKQTEKKFMKKRKYVEAPIEGEKKDQKDIASESYMQTVFRRFRHHRLAMVSLVVVIILGGAALLAPVIAPYDPDAIAGPFSGAPSSEFWLGTDQIGRDVFSRLLYAMRISLLVGIMATLISTIVGVVLGLIAGFWRCGRYDHYAFYRYGHVLSLHSSGAGGSGYF